MLIRINLENNSLAISKYHQQQLHIIITFFYDIWLKIIQKIEISVYIYRGDEHTHHPMFVIFIKQLSNKLP